MALVKGVNCGFVTTAPTSNPIGGVFNTFDNDAWAFGDTTPAGATTITEIGWWCDNATQEANFEVGIYTNVGDAPTDVVGSLSQTNAKGTGSGWKVVSGLNIPVNPSTNYFIAVQLDDTSTPTASDRTGAGGEKTYGATGNPTTLTDPFAGGSSFGAYLVGFYAKVTVGSSATDNMTIIGENIY